MDSRCEAVEFHWTIGRKAAREVARNVLFVQQLERQLFVVAMETELVTHRAERMLVGKRLDRPVAPNNQQPRRLGPPRNRGD